MSICPRAGRDALSITLLVVIFALIGCGTGGGAETDVGPEASGSKDFGTEAHPTDDLEDATEPWDPGAQGPYPVGITELALYDEERDREVRTVVWYPAAPDGQEPVTYLLFVEGGAFVDAPADPAEAPYPLVLFSHGFAGIAEQSLTLMEHLASHGYVVAAMDHFGNTIKNANADDDQVAAVALERPVDVRYAYEQVAVLSESIDHLLSGLADPQIVAVMGHSFGGYTALMTAGGVVDVDAAQATCDAGTQADIMCPYMPYWPAGETVALDPALPHLVAAVALAPGGSAAFGPGGLAGVAVPVLVFGGSRDETTPVDVEIHQIYDALPAPKAEAIIANAAHLSFTNICDIPIAAAALDDFCGVEEMRGPAETFAVVNAMTTAFLDVHLKGLDAHGALLAQEALNERFGAAVTWSTQGL